MAKSAIQELKIGPYAGGINRYSDMSAIADDEMVDCVNFDIDLDGSLKSRPPWKLLYGEYQLTSTGTLPPDSHQLLLGSFVYESVQFIIFNSNHYGSYSAWVYFLGGENDGTIQQLAAGTYSNAIRYGNDIYLMPGPEGGETSLGTGQRYDLSSGLVAPITNMPRGYASCVYKDRLWISGRRNITNNSRLFFSDLANFNSWPTANFFDVNVGDGDAVHDLLVYQDNLLIFKDNATYVLSYDQGPAQAVLQTVNPTIGVMGPHCVQAYENSVFVLQYNEVYEMQNYDYTRVSVKIPFEYDHTTPFEGQKSTVDEWWKYAQSLSLVGDRLIARFFNRQYIYHLRLRAWTRWESDDESVHYIGPIKRLDNTNTDLNRGYESYVACSALGKVTDQYYGMGSTGSWRSHCKIFIFEDRYEYTNQENGCTKPEYVPSVDINLSMTTKTYDVGLSHRFKRLMHWGIDCITGRGVTGTIYPFSIVYKITWNQLHSKRWHELNTWGYPMFTIPSVTQNSPIGAGIARRFVRFPKSLRFRLVQFKVDMSTVGNLSDGPARLYSLTVFVGSKQLISGAVN